MAKPSAKTPRLEAGLRLDQYELLYAIAEGQWSSVWLARLAGKRGFERLVALKVIVPEPSRSRRQRRAFLDEARIAAKIQHEHVAETRDLGEASGVIYFVMEWVDGDPLAHLLAAVTQSGADFPVPVALRIVADACAGVHGAHEARGDDDKPLEVVHRSLGLGNLLVSTSGVVKVIDFGLAKAREGVVDETKSGELRSRMDGVAPEVALGRPVDRRADVWSLGAVLYALCAGAPPWGNLKPRESIAAMAAGRPPAPLPDRVPSLVRFLVNKAMAHDPKGRFATAEEMRAAVEEALRSMGHVGREEVAALVATHLAPRIRHRTVAVQVALAAAAERARGVDARVIGAPEPPPTEGFGIAGKVSLDSVSAAVKQDSRPVLEVDAEPPPRNVFGSVALFLVAVVVGAALAVMLRGKLFPSTPPAATATASAAASATATTTASATPSSEPSAGAASSAEPTHGPTTRPPGPSPTPWAPPPKQKPAGTDDGF